MGSTVFSLEFLGHTGAVYDGTLLMNYIRARSYRPAVGRWMSMDPYSFLHEYLYASNRPVVRVDPSGNKDYFINFEYLFSDTHVVSQMPAIQSEVDRIFQACFETCSGASGHTLSIRWTPVKDQAAYQVAKRDFGWVGGRPGPSSAWEGIGEALLCEPACTGIFSIYYWCTKCPDGINIGAHDSVTAGTLGITGDYEIGINPSLIRQKAVAADKDFPAAVAMVISHESGHHVIADDSFHGHTGFVDSSPGKVGSTFSPNCCGRICKAFCLG
jgi:RHS repeat-associated protein